MIIRYQMMIKVNDKCDVCFGTKLHENTPNISINLT